MNENLHKKIEEALSSLDGLQRAEASPYLYSKIRNRMQQPVVAKQLAWRMVIALLVVALVNIVTLRQVTGDKNSTGNGAELLATEYAISLPQTY